MICDLHRPGSARLGAALMLMAAALLGGRGEAAPVPTLKVIAVDPLVNVFRDDALEGTTTATADSARGEHATWQLVVTSSPVALKGLRCEVTSLTLAGAAPENAVIPAPSVRFVGYIGTSSGSKKPARDRLRPIPGTFPDPLLEEESLDVDAGDNQALWLTVKVPETAHPGEYQATAVVSARIFGHETSSTLPLILTVYPATITSTRLNVTQWFQLWHHHDYPMPERFSPAYWDMLRQYVRNMVAHRQNWARVETLWIVGYKRDEKGELQFDFTNFDKWVSILFEEGIRNIEGLQYAWRSGAWESPFHVEVHDENDPDYKGRKVPPDSEEARKFYSAFFPKLHAHLKEKGWLERYAQHVGDEPVARNADSYTTAARLLRTYAPGIPVMEACLSHNMVGAIDIWVPILHELHRDFDFFQERRKEGDRVWFYTCLNPTGEYANRFVELPLIKTRLLHWINYRYDIEGFLHWGYNFWRPHPWDNASDVRGNLPGGDAWIVYPEKGGPGIVESIRYEAMRDGIEDHELLSQLGEKDPEKAMELARRHILDFNRYNTDVKEFRRTRRELLEAVSALVRAGAGVSPAAE